MQVLRFLMMALKGLGGLFAMLLTYRPTHFTSRGGGNTPLLWLAATAVMIFGMVAAVGDVMNAYVEWWPYAVTATVLYGALIQVGLWWPDPQDPWPESRWPLALDRVLVSLLVTIVVLILTLAVTSLVWFVIKSAIPWGPYILVTLVLVVLIVLWAWLAPDPRDRQRRQRKLAARHQAGPPKTVDGGETPADNDLVS